MRTLSLMLGSLLLSVPALAQHDEHAAHLQATSGTQTGAFQLPVNEKLPKRALDAAAFARIAGGDRSAFDRLTLQPRVMIPTRGLDLGLTLFGHAHHSPIIVGPIDGGSFPDPGADALLLRGASAANATVVAAGATATRAEIRQMKTPVWCQVFATDPAAGCDTVAWS